MAEEDWREADWGRGGGFPGQQKELNITFTCVFALTGSLDVEPAWPTDLPAEEEILQAGGVGPKYMRECLPLQVRGQWWHLCLHPPPNKIKAG